jgi:hemerythrin-like metal-binding protein
MDEEHKGLIALMNRVYDLNQEGASKETLLKALQDLIAAVVKHFEHEEKFIDSVKFPEATIHKALHKRLLRRMEEFMVEFNNGDGKVSNALFGFLSVWLSSHIMGSDREYGMHATGRTPAKASGSGV